MFCILGHKKIAESEIEFVVRSVRTKDSSRGGLSLKSKGAGWGEEGAGAFAGLKDGRGFQT